MNFLDILFIVVIALFTLRGFYRGLVREIISILSIFLAFTIASRYHHVLSPHLTVYINNEATVQSISYVLVFFGVLVICWAVARLLRELLEIALLGWLDRLAGLLFGMLEGGVVLLITLLILTSFFKNATFMKESTLAPKARPALVYVMQFMPDSFKETMRKRGLKVPERDEASFIKPDHPDLDDLINDTVENTQPPN